jgi:hypothetical protein
VERHGSLGGLLAGRFVGLAIEWRIGVALPWLGPLSNDIDLGARTGGLGVRGRVAQIGVGLEGRVFTAVDTMEQGATLDDATDSVCGVDDHDRGPSVRGHEHGGFFERGFTVERDQGDIHEIESGRSSLCSIECRESLTRDEPHHTTVLDDHHRIDVVGGVIRTRIGLDGLEVTMDE